MRPSLSELPVAKLLSNIFPPDSIRFVGGCVRDSILGYTCDDYDFATSLVPQHVIDILKENNIRYFLYGISHGTITAIVEKYTIEITTLRRDVVTYGRRADIEFTSSWAEDASRRDITINAMYLSLDGKLYDYFDGHRDLCNNTIKFVGDAKTRILEDHLRILRFFRFFSRYGSQEADKHSIDAIKSGIELITKISSSRIRKEFFGIFGNRNSYRALRYMCDIGLVHVLIPGISQEVIDVIKLYKRRYDFLDFLAICIYHGYNIAELKAVFALSRKELRVLQAIKYYALYCLNCNDGISRFIASGHSKILPIIIKICDMLDIEINIPHKYYHDTFPVKKGDISLMLRDKSQTNEVYTELCMKWLNSSTISSKQDCIDIIDRSLIA